MKIECQETDPWQPGGCSTRPCVFYFPLFSINRSQKTSHTTNKQANNKQKCMVWRSFWTKMAQTGIKSCGSELKRFVGWNTSKGHHILGAQKKSMSQPAGRGPTTFFDVFYNGFERFSFVKWEQAVPCSIGVFLDFLTGLGRSQGWSELAWVSSNHVERSCILMPPWHAVRPSANFWKIIKIEAYKKLQSNLTSTF